MCVSCLCMFIKSCLNDVFVSILKCVFKFSILLCDLLYILLYMELYLLIDFPIGHYDYDYEPKR